jgi:type IV pilus assembly protein PilX
MKTKHRTQLHVSSHQRGAVLVVALLMLLVMTVLGVTAMQMSRSEERMAGNSRDINLAFQGAEAGLRDGEERLRPLLAAPTVCSTAPCNFWAKDIMPADLRNQLLSWWTTNGREYGVAGTQEVTDTTRDPRVVIEELGFLSDSLSPPPGEYGAQSGRTFYRVTSGSTGASAAALTDPPMAVLESTYAKRYK